KPNRFVGTGSGQYVCNLIYGSTPTGFHFTGTASITGIGVMGLQADVYGVGFKTTGQATGKLVLSDGKGTITLSLGGPTQTKLAALPTQFSYQVISASGAYAAIKRSGTLQLVRTPAASPIRNGIKFVEVGTFKITF